MYKWVAAVVMSIAVFDVAAQVKDGALQHQFTLRIAVTMPGEYADLIRSGLARELRRLDTVEVVDEKNADHVLHVVGVTTTAGGLAVAVTLETRLDVTPVMYFSSDERCHPTQKQTREIAGFYDDVSVVDNLWVFTDRDVQSLVSRIAAALDVNAVEHYRQIEHRLEDFRRRRATERKQ